VYYTKRRGGHWTLIHRELTNTLDSITQLTFLLRRYQLSRIARKLVGAIAIKWYKILGYIGPNTIKQLPKHVNSIELELNNKRAPLKIECEVC
jgi:hypothetical protein